MEKIGLEAVLQMGGFRNGVNEYTSSITGMEGKTSKLASVLGGAGKAIAGVGVAAGAAVVGGVAIAAKALASTIEPASNLEESMNKVSVVFGENAGAVLDWAATANTAMGSTRQQALEAAGTFGNLFTSMGMGTDVSADMSQDLVQLAADLGSFNNIPIDVALEKLRSGLVGEVEPLRTLGVQINAATVEAKAMEMGLISAGEEMTEQDKVLARYALILEQTSNAQGDFARTSEGWANQQKIVKATFEDIKATIGQAILPSLTKLSAKFTEWLNSPAVREGIQRLAAWLGENLPKAIDALSDWFTNTLVPAIQSTVQWFRDNLVPAIQAVASWFRDNLMPVIQTVAGWFRGEGSSSISEFATKIRTFLQPAIEFAQQMFQKIISWVQTNWPLIQETVGSVMQNIKAGIEVVLGIIQGLWERYGETILGVVSNVWEMLKTIISTAIDVIGGIIRTVMQIISGDWEGAWETIKEIGRTVWEAIKTIISLAWDNISSIFMAAYQTVTDIFRGIGEWFMGIGESIVNGIRSGIEGGWNAFVSWVLGLLSGLKSKILQFFGIESPSKVFAEMGHNLMAGLAAGISGGLEMPVTAMVGAGAATVGAMTASTAGGATGGGVTRITNNQVGVTTNPTINSGMDLAEFEMAIERTVQRAIRGV